MEPQCSLVRRPSTIKRVLIDAAAVTAAAIRNGIRDHCVSWAEAESRNADMFFREWSVDSRLLLVDTG